MAKFVFTAELSFDTDAADITAVQALQKLKDGMSMWPSCDAPHVSVDIKEIFCNGRKMQPFKTTD